MASRGKNWSLLRDQGRLRGLSEAVLIDSGSDAAFDRQTWLATKALNAPIAFIALLDDQREVVKSAIALGTPWTMARQLPLSHSLSKYVVANGRALLVDDAREHPELKHCPMVSAFSVVAYAGVPLTTSNGHTLGALCVVDTKARAWSIDDERVLRELAATLMTEIELRATVGTMQVTELELSSTARLQAALTSLRLLALMDELTGLHNRRGFMALAEHQIKLAERNDYSLLVFFADLDGLKQINDRLGHDAGDQALRDIAALLRVTFRESDVLARLGGDEFVVLASNANLEDVARFDARLCAALDRYNSRPKRGFQLSLSAGATVFNPRDPTSLETLLRHADAAMYEDKRRRASLRPTP